MANSDEADRQLWREIYRSLQDFGAATAAARDEIKELRKEVVALDKNWTQMSVEIEQFEKAEERLNAHLNDVPQIRSAIERTMDGLGNRLTNAERLIVEHAGKLADNEREKIALIKKQKEDLEQEQKETTKYRRGLIASLLTIGSAVLGAVGYVVKLFLDWWNQTK